MEMLHISTALRAFPFRHPVLSNDVLCKIYNDVELINTIPYHTIVFYDLNKVSRSRVTNLGGYNVFLPTHFSLGF